MANKNIAILAAALLVGGVAAYGTKSYISDRVADIEARNNDKEVTVDVVVASATLEKGVKLNAENLASRSVPVEWVHSNAITPDQFDRISGATLAYPARKGEPIIWSQIESETTATFSTMLTPGRRAVTVPVDEISSISGMVSPNDLIDIVVSTQKDGVNYTFTLLQSVKVLATGTQISADRTDANGNAITFNTITLDTFPREAKQVIAAREVGKITALLRSPEDEGLVSTSRSDAAALLGLSGQAGLSTVPVIYGGGPIKEGLSMKDNKTLETLLGALNPSGSEAIATGN